MSKPNANEYIFELCGYILNCAEMVLSPRGSTRYSVLRYMDVLRRVIDISDYVDCVDEDAYLLELKEKLQKLPIEGDQMEKLREALQGLLLEYAEEANKRV